MAPFTGNEAAMAPGGQFAGQLSAPSLRLRHSGNDGMSAFEARHARKEARSSAPIVIFIIIELLIAAALTYAVFSISMSHITERRGDAVAASVENMDAAVLVASADNSYRLAMEQVAEVVDETVWTKVAANYRVGPSITYDKIGTLNKYASVQRTGLTYNKWSRVIIDDRECYIRSRNLTTEAPLITAPGAKGDYQRYALSLMSDYGWAESEIIPLIKLWDRESGWNPSAHNGGSGAHGIPQALPASKMASEGSDYYTNGNTQIRWGLSYIKGRYGSPSNAWGHFCACNWY